MLKLGGYPPKKSNRATLKSYSQLLHVRINIPLLINWFATYAFETDGEKRILFQQTLWSCSNCKSKSWLKDKQNHTEKEVFGKQKIENGMKQQERTKRISTGISCVLWFRFQVDAN